jgi:hypothetical protein
MSSVFRWPCELRQTAGGAGVWIRIALYIPHGTMYLMNYSNKVMLKATAENGDELCMILLILE